MKILTHKGFKEFDGFIEQKKTKRLLNIVCDSGKNLKCTHDHLLKTCGDKFLEAEKLQVGNILHGSEKIVEIEEINADEEVPVYDALNVEDTNSYITNGLVSHNCLYLDEFAFVENAEKFYTSTYPVISAGKESRVIITSTANGVGNPFYNIYEGAKTGKNEYVATRVDWWDVPGRDENWKRQTIANTSERQFEQEFGNAFHSTGSTLIAGDCLLRINTEKPIKSTDSWNIYADPEEGHIYVLSIDVALGRGGDYSAATIIDISSSPFKQVAVYRNNRISPMLLADVMVPVAKKYNNAHIIVEVNNGGSQVANDIYHDYEYENMHLESAIRADGVGLTMNKKTKRIGCSHLKDLIESGQLQIVDTQTLQELSTFSVSGSSYAATQGNHDDIVMTLVSFAFVMQTLLSDEDKSLKDLLFDKLAENIEEDLLPPGIFDDRSATDSAPKSMEIHEKMVKDIDDWNL